VAKLVLYISSLIEKRAAVLIKQLFFFSFIFIIITLMLTFSVNAQEINLIYNNYIENNTLSVSDIIDLSSENDLKEELKKYKFKNIHEVDYYNNKKNGMKFVFDKFSISYNGVDNHSINGSKQTLKFLNRINKHNQLNEINNIYLAEKEVDFNVLKISYYSDKYNFENTKFNFNFDFNYYQGKNFRYDIYRADLNFKNSTNPFYKDPVQAQGNWKEYYNMSGNNNGLGLGLAAEAEVENILFNLKVDNIGASINWDKVKYKNKIIDTETASFDENDNINYDSTVSGTWMNFDYKMDLPLKINLHIEQKFNDLIFGTDLKWQEWRIGEIKRDEYSSQNLFLAYKNENNNIYKLEYDFNNSIGAIIFNSKNIKIELLTDKINIKNAQILSLKTSFEYKF
jgi:hypothetical protein